MAPVAKKEGRRRRVGEKTKGKGSDDGGRGAYDSHGGRGEGIIGLGRRGNPVNGGEGTLRKLTKGAYHDMVIGLGVTQAAMLML